MKPGDKAIAPRLGASDIYEQISAELIQIGNRHPAARRDCDDLERLVRRAAHAKDDLDEAKLLQAKRAGWDLGYSAGLDKLPGDRQRFPRP